MELKSATSNPAPAPPPLSKPVRKKKKPIYLRRWFLWMFGTFFMLGVLSLVGLWIFLAPFKKMAEQFDLELGGQLEKASVIFDRKGRELGRIFVENRRIITIDKVSQNFKDALISEEDKSFL